MRIIICTGNGGIGSALAASMTASAAAQAGRKTILASIGPSHSIGAVLGTLLTSEPQSLALNLDAWELDAANDLSAFMSEIRSRLFGNLAHLSGEELPLMLGIDFFLALERIRRARAAGYELAVIDAGQHDTLLRVLALPDSFRWFVRLMFGIDRGTGKNMQSVGRAMMPTSLLPFEWVSAIQDARVQFEQLRDEATAIDTTTVRYVLRPDRAALAEARLAVAALHLHGLAVDALLAGPLLPTDVADTRLQAVTEQEQAVLQEAAQLWQPRPTFSLPLGTHPTSAAQLAGVGQALYGEHRPDNMLTPVTPIMYSHTPDPLLAISLPGVPREALNLTMSGDELIVRVGPYRRHILLPEGLRGKNNIRASREGERLLVRLRPS
jgi:anion-transporting  ArsA/GET3 family ATPase